MQNQKETTEIRNFTFEEPILVTKNLIHSKPNTRSHVLHIPMKHLPIEGKTIIDYEKLGDSRVIQVATSNVISKSILSASDYLASSINRLTDEFERKNKLDEFYMLLNKIEEYENILQDMGKLKEVYEKLELAFYPSMEVDESHICLLLCFGKEILEQVLILMQNTRWHPLKALYKFLVTTYKNDEWHLAKSHGLMYIRFTDKNFPFSSKYDALPFPWLVNGLDSSCTYVMLDNYWEACGTVVTFPLVSSSLSHQVFLGHSHVMTSPFVCYTSGNLDHTIRNRNLSKIYMEDPETTISCFIKKVYECCVNDHEIENMYLKDHYIMLPKAIDNINLETQLSNLRCLYIALRNAVREYKMSDIQ